MTNDQLDMLKTALQIDDDDKDNLLQLYLDDAEDFLRLRLSLKDDEEMPKSMLAIVRGAAVKKFNRFKNEGMQSYSQEGESITFNASDFDEWADEIAQWRRENGKGVNNTVGRWIDPYAIR